MNDAELQERARERLLVADLSTVLGSPLRAVEPRERPASRYSWYAAAMLLLGVVVAGGVAWLQRAETASLQAPAADPIEPWFETQWPFRRRPMPLLESDVPALLDRVPVTEEEYLISISSPSAPTLAALLERPSLRRVGLGWVRSSSSGPLEPELWQRLVQHRELESLLLSGETWLTAEQVRELRHLPKLQTLCFFEGSITFDRALAEALVELPHLRCLALHGIEIEPAALAVLAGLPHLDTLLLGGRRFDAPVVLAQLSVLRNLQALVCEDRDDQTWSAATVALLDRLPRLRMLDLACRGLDDAALAALPAGLERLSLGNLDLVSADGLSSLRRLTRLRMLGFRAMLPERLDAVVPELVAALPIERFDHIVAVPDPALWRALQAKPALRRLQFGNHFGSFVDLLAGCARCPRLESVAVQCQALPTAAELTVLRDHPTLRRLEFGCREPLPAAAELAALGVGMRAQIHAYQNR